MKRMATTVVDIDEHPEWKKQVSIVPTFWLARRSTQTRVKAWSGSTDVDTIEREVTRIRETKSASHETLINHLLNDGIHRGRWQIDILGEMSDDALNDAHDQDHGWK